MPEGSSPAPAAALAGWLASPLDPQRLAGLVAAARLAPVPASTIDRLPAACFTTLAQAEVRFAGLKPQVRRALLVFSLGNLLALDPSPEERREHDAMPFSVRASATEVLIEVSAVNDRRGSFGQPGYHQWAAGVEATAVVIDCGRLDQVNSVLIAWMLQIVQSARPVPVKVLRAKPQVATQLRQLRLDHLMQIL